MAKAKAEGVSKSQIFRRYFEKRPDLLRESSFDDVMAMYKQEFPDRAFSDSDRQIAANIKSRMRKERKISRRRRRRRVGAGAGSELGTATPRTHRGASSLHFLEEQIDNCLVA